MKANKEEKIKLIQDAISAFEQLLYRPEQEVGYGEGYKEAVTLAKDSISSCFGWEGSEEFERKIGKSSHSLDYNQHLRDYLQNLTDFKQRLQV